MVKNMSSTTTKRCSRFFKVFLPEYCSERLVIYALNFSLCDLGFLLEALNSLFFLILYSNVYGLCLICDLQSLFDEQDGCFTILCLTMSCKI